MRTDWIDTTTSDTAPDADAPQPLDALGGDTRGPAPLSTATAPAPAKIPLPQDLIDCAIARPVPLKLADKHQALIARVDDRIRTRAATILANAFLADRMDDPEAVAKMTSRQLKTASDASRNGKEAPVYLAMAAKLMDSFKRAEAHQVPVSPELHADIKVYVRQELTVNYRTMDLEDKDRE